MDELIADGGVIRKVWIGEADKFREHLLRLDADSRRNRFGGALADELILAYAETAMQIGTVMHGFLVDGILRGVAELKPLGTAFPGVAEVAFSIEKPWQSHGVGSALPERTLLAARNRRIQLAHAADRPHGRGRAELRCRQRRGRGRGAACDAAVALSRVRRRRPRLCDGRARRPGARHTSGWD